MCYNKNADDNPKYRWETTLWVSGPAAWSFVSVSAGIRQQKQKKEQVYNADIPRKETYSAHG